MRSQTLQFIASHSPGGSDEIELTLSPLSGGLESAVARAKVAFPANARSAIPRRFVVKELRGAQRRETDIYQELWRNDGQPPAARLLGAHEESTASYLYLEEIRSFTDWPWASTEHAAAVCIALAKLHRSRSSAARVFSEWDYEAELTQSADDTLRLAETAKTSAGARSWERLGDLYRVVAQLPALRAEILNAGATLIHGDMHPGNVIVRSQRSKQQVVLIDWARARMGSPLEDLASWLHSLGCWEPQARRRHDTLFRAYLGAHDATSVLDAGLRRRYWFASATNGLAGAIRYHLSVVSNPESAEAQPSNSTMALRAWARVIRRAAALIGSGRLSK